MTREHSNENETGGGREIVALSVSNWIALTSLVVVVLVALFGSWVSIKTELATLKANQVGIRGDVDRLESALGVTYIRP